MASAQGDELLNQAVDINGIKVLASLLEGADSKTLRETLDKLERQTQIGSHRTVIGN
ncbi:MAG: hypothetical protein WDM70_10850 [Nitrosomonadales bacterium]